MAQQTPSAPSPDDMHWGISYLREDIQDLRQEIRANFGRVDEKFGRVDERFGRVDERFGRMDERFESLSKRIDSRFGLLLMAMIGLHSVTVGTIVAFLRLSG